jgi:hypothetical protein
MHREAHENILTFTMIMPRLIETKRMFQITRGCVVLYGKYGTVVLAYQAAPTILDTPPQRWLLTLAVHWVDPVMYVH